MASGSKQVGKNVGFAILGIVIVAIVIIIVILSANAIEHKKVVNEQQNALNNFNNASINSSTSTNQIATKCDPASLTILNEVPNLTTCGDCKDLAVGGVCNFACTEPNLLFIGQANVTCLQTGFSDISVYQPPACVVKPTFCPPIYSQSQENSFGIQVGSICVGAVNGDVCNLFCNPGNEPTAESQQNGKLTCVDGQWSGMFICEQTNCSEVP